MASTLLSGAKRSGPKEALSSPEQATSEPSPSEPSPPATAAAEQTPPAAGPGTEGREIDRVFEEQRRLRWQVPSLQQRLADLKRMLDWIESNGDAIRQAGVDDFAKPPIEVDLTEIVPALSEVRFAISNLAKWMKPKRVKRVLALASTSSRIHYEPRGVVLIISPWNYPFNLTVCPLVSALASGNRVIIKPSEATPHHSALLARMVRELFDPAQVALFEGEADVAKALLDKPFDHIFFTGSPAIGRHVMAAAARHLSTVTLELGGKSPVIVDASANLADAAAKIQVGKWLNAGQTCIAPDYVLVERSVMPELLKRLESGLERSYGKTAEARRRSPDLARIVNDRHFDRLSHLLDSSLEGGATLAFGGERDPSSRYFGPTLLTDVDARVEHELPVMREEIFGPILPICAYDHLDEAIDIVRSRPKPLALYMMSRRRAAVDKVLASTSAGGTCVNEVAAHFMHPRLPFGGVNHSGHGSAHGEFGFRAFSHERAVLSHHRFSPFRLLKPPYSKTAAMLVALTRRLL